MDNHNTKSGRHFRNNISGHFHFGLHSDNLGPRHCVRTQQRQIVIINPFDRQLGILGYKPQHTHMEATTTSVQPSYAPIDIQVMLLYLWLLLVISGI